MTNTTTEIRVSAYCVSHYDNETRSYTLDYTAPTHVETRSPDYDTREEAEAFAAAFPKSAKFIVTECRHYGEAGRSATYSASNRATLAANGVNGGVNETGLRRYRATIRAAEKLGMAVTFTTGAINSYPTRAAFEEALA